MRTCSKIAIKNICFCFVIGFHRVVVYVVAAVIPHVVAGGGVGVCAAAAVAATAVCGRKSGRN